MKDVRFLRRRNLGQYEHTELEVSGVIPDGESATKYTKELMDFVHDALFSCGEFSAPVKGKASQVEMKLETKVEKGPKTSTEKVETEKIQNQKQGEVTKSEEKPQDMNASSSTAEPKKEEKKEEPKKEEKKTRAGKPTPYDRNLETHKALMGTFLDSSLGKNWRDKSILAASGKASRDLQGKDFLDGNGDIIESFKTEFLRIRSEELKNLQA